MAEKTKAPADCGPSSVTAMGEVAPNSGKTTVPLLGTVVEDQLPLVAQLVVPPGRSTSPRSETTLLMISSEPPV